MNVDAVLVEVHPVGLHVSNLHCHIIHGGGLSRRGDGRHVGNVLLDVHHETSRLDDWLPPSLSLRVRLFSSIIPADESDLSLTQLGVLQSLRSSSCTFNSCTSFCFISSSNLSLTRSWLGILAFTDCLVSRFHSKLDGLTFHLHVILTVSTCTAVACCFSTWCTPGRSLGHYYLPNRSHNPDALLVQVNVLGIEYPSDSFRDKSSPPAYLLIL